MVRYLYAWLPAMIVFGVGILLTNAYLALIVLMPLLLAVLAILVGGIVWAPYVLVRYAGQRRWEHAPATTPPRLSTGPKRAGAR